MQRSTTFRPPAPVLDRSLSLPEALYESGTMLCRRCGLARVFHRRKTRHRIHFAIVLGTVGLWLPVWLALIIRQALLPWKCEVCGELQRRGGLKNAPR